VNDVCAELAERDLWPPERIADVQAERLGQTVARAARAPFYAEAFADAATDPSRVASLDDLRRLPFTTKDDLRANMPWGFLAVPRRDVVRMHYSSGTTGIATAVYHTAADIENWADNVVRGMIAAGVSADDVFQNMMTYGLFTGGLGLHYAAEKLGCMAIPAGAGNTARQVHLMQVFGTTVIHILPSYALRLALHCAEAGVDPVTDLELRVAFIGAEPHTDGTRRRIEAALGVEAYNCYGLSEMAGPGVAMGCPAQAGLHLREDQFLAEVVDPETLEPVAEGEQGELVLTSLTREAMPLIRYRTRDLTRLLPGPCPCGRSHRRIAPIFGRSDDMFIVKGVNVYPMQVERVLTGFPELGSNWVIVLDRHEGGDRMTVLVELSPQFWADDARTLDSLRERAQHELRGETLVTPEVELLEPGRLPAGEGKAARVEDRRGEM
jgi:phenylacetate-CoA ligase